MVENVPVEVIWMKSSSILDALKSFHSHLQRKIHLNNFQDQSKLLLIMLSFFFHIQIIGKRNVH